MEIRCKKMQMFNLTMLKEWLLGTYLKYIIVLCYVLIICNGDMGTSIKNVSSILSRQRRYLPFLGNSIVIVVGVGIPVQIDNNHVLVGTAIRATYHLPTNISQLTIADYRKKRSLSRWNIYKLLEQDSYIRGHGGRHCILRLICEESDTPLDRYNGLFEELLHVLFTPTTTNENIDNFNDRDYYKAQRLGKKYTGRCKQFFPRCKLTILDKFTRYYNPH